MRDAAFGIYQTNVIFIMGLIGGPLVIWFLIQAFRGGRWRAAEAVLAVADRVFAGGGSRGCRASGIISG